MFGISKMEIKNIDSPEIRTCTFSAEIESIVVDVSRHILSIKDAFYTVCIKIGISSYRVLNLVCFLT